MILHSPFMISSRLMAAVQVGGATISIGYCHRRNSGKIVYDVWIDLPGRRKGFHETSLKSGCGGGGLQKGMESLLSFFGAAAESYRYAKWEGENAGLFARPVVEWAAANSDELSMLLCEIEETPNLLEES